MSRSTRLANRGLICGQGRDVGNVVVRKKTAHGLVDAVHGIDFAFAFSAFNPDGVIAVE